MHENYLKGSYFSQVSFVSIDASFEKIFYSNFEYINVSISISQVATSATRNNALLQRNSEKVLLKVVSLPNLSFAVIKSFLFL